MGDYTHEEVNHALDSFHRDIERLQQQISDYESVLRPMYAMFIAFCHETYGYGPDGIKWPTYHCQAQDVLEKARAVLEKYKEKPHE
jgi:hypothetical protein